MGLDIVMYDKDNKKIGLCEIIEELHMEIFNTHYWRSYRYLSEVQDYYLTNKIFSRMEIDGLINDLSNYKQYVSENSQVEINKIIGVLSNKIISKVHFAGD